MYLSTKPRTRLSMNFPSSTPRTTQKVTCTERRTRRQKRTHLISISVKHWGSDIGLRVSPRTTSQTERINRTGEVPGLPLLDLSDRPPALADDLGGHLLRTDLGQLGHQLDHVRADQDQVTLKRRTTVVR